LDIEVDCNFFFFFQKKFTLDEVVLRFESSEEKSKNCFFSKVNERGERSSRFGE